MFDHDVDDDATTLKFVLKFHKDILYYCFGEHKKNNNLSILGALAYILNYHSLNTKPLLFILLTFLLGVDGFTPDWEICQVDY